MGKDLKVQFFKMPFNTKMFRYNQKVYIVYSHGAPGYCVIGKYQGKGRYIKTFVNFDSKERQKHIPVKIQEIDGTNLNRRIREECCYED